MVAKACSSTSSEMPVLIAQEKGSRNKRKFCADPPLADPNKIIPLPQHECTSFGILGDKFEIIPNHGHTNGDDMSCMNQDSPHALKLDLGLSCTVGTSAVGPSQPREEIEASKNEFHDVDWSDLTESQLEELILSNLDTIFKSAIKRIIASGYGEEAANKAILRSGIWYGCKDMVSNIVENTLAFLRSGQEIGPSREHCFEDLQQMEKYILAELVCLLKEVRPFFSTGDAMWCLLICDMNVSHACAMDSEPSGSLLGDAASNGNFSISAPPQLRTVPRSFKFGNSVPCKPNASVSYKCLSEASSVHAGHRSHSLQSEEPNVRNCPNMNPETSFALNGLVPVGECNKSISNISERPFSAAGISPTTVAEEKLLGSRKVSAVAKREYILRQKSIHFEKHYLSHGLKATSRSGKLGSFSGLVLDKKLKAAADSTGINSKNTPSKIGSGIGFDRPQNNVNFNLSTGTGFNSVPTFGLDATNGSSLPEVTFKSSPSLPVADTELSLTFPAKTVAIPTPISYNIEAANWGNVGSSNDKSLGQWVPHDREDEMIMKLVPRVRELENQLQEWTEWANQKVMQAARRLGKDKAELKTLRQVKEEVERLKKEKQALEENTMKKLTEKENAWCKARRQVEQANAAVRRLGAQNAALRQEMEAAKLRAAESAASCQEVLKREKRTLLKFQSWEKQRTILQEDLAAEKRKLMQLQQKLKQAQDAQDRAKARLNQEEKAKDELFTKMGSFKKERDQIEVSAKSEEDMIKLRAQNNLLKYKDNIDRLEKDISQLRLKTDSSKIAALRRGIDGSYASKVTYLKTTPSLKDSAASYISRIMTSTDFHDFTGNGGVKRERECVMCLSDEMSVVFLPCAHQVVCTKCNELHEKQGMKDCPSCRSPIQWRICVRFCPS